MAIVAVPIALAEGFTLRPPLHVVDDNKIEQPVVVYVDPRGADGPERTEFLVRLIETGFCGHVRKGAVAVVVIQRVAVHARDKNVFAAVVVVIGDSDSNVVTGAGESGLFG